MKQIIAYRVVGLDLVIPLRDWQSFDGRYYAMQGYEFEAVWAEAE